MEQWEIVDRNKFAVFLRNLTENNKVNLKYMIEDIDKTEIKNVKKMKKKDFIIQEQQKVKRKKLMETELKMINYMIENNNSNNYENIGKLKLDESKLLYKCKLFEKYRNQMKEKNNTNNDDLFNLYYDLSNNYDKLEDKYKVLVVKMKKVLKKYDTKSYMMENLGHLMPPLNVWDKSVISLEEWQKNVIKLIKDKKSILIKAPTSSGKTFIAMSTGILHKRILYVCPSKPVAYQVGANYIKMGHKVHFLLSNLEDMNYDMNTNIFIGTPDKIEDNLPKLLSTINFEYIVYDEIHTSCEKIEYENIIKMLNIPYLALSATIDNIQELKHNIELYNNNKNEYIEFNNRFINQQRWIYNDTLVKLHPCICFNDFSIDNINFTSNDCYDLYCKIDMFDEVEDLEPDEYFPAEKMITLDEMKIYEINLKHKLKLLHEKYPNKIRSIIDKYNVIHKNINIDDTILDLLFTCKDKDMLPALYFNSNEINAKSIFKIIYNKLEEYEKEQYPFHYDILEKKDKIYKISKNRLDEFRSSIKVKTKDATTEINSKLENYKNKELLFYKTKVKEYYTLCISKCTKIYQKINLQKELASFLKYPDYRSQDIYKKHPNMCFTKGEPMSGDDIKFIRKELKHSIGINISYNSELFQLLKRGIGIYIESMPDKYNWIVQKLLSDKKLGIVITDKTLCLGIDLPIRTTILSGYNDNIYSINDYLQMSGRAGRRGLDNQGNIIFHGVKNYKELMSNKYPKVLFNNKHYDNYSIIRNRYMNTKNIYNNEILEFSNKKYNKLLWILRYYENSYEWIKNLDKYETDISNNHKGKELDYVLGIIETLTNIKFKHNYYNNIYDTSFITIGEILRKIYNTLDNHNYKNIKTNLLIIFNKCKDLVFRNKLDLAT